MSKPSLILIGAGAHAHACIDVIEQNGEYEIAGLVGMHEELRAEHIGYKVIATDAELPQLVQDYQYALITVGQIQSPDKRIHLYRQAVELGFQVPTIIAPTAIVSAHASIGAGTIVMHNAIVNARAGVGENCIINTRALIEHDALIEAHCHISTGAILNGSVRVGAGSFIGSGCVIKDGVSIGKNSLVGMALAVRHNLADRARFVGLDIS